MLQKIKAFLIEEDGSESAEYGVLTGIVLTGVAGLAAYLHTNGQGANANGSLLNRAMFWADKAKNQL